MTQYLVLCSDSTKGLDKKKKRKKKKKKTSMCPVACPKTAERHRLSFHFIDRKTAMRNLFNNRTGRNTQK